MGLTIWDRYIACPMKLKILNVSKTKFVGQSSNFTCKKADEMHSQSHKVATLSIVSKVNIKTWRYLAKRWSFSCLEFFERSLAV